MYNLQHVYGEFMQASQTKICGCGYRRPRPQTRLPVEHGKQLSLCKNNIKRGARDGFPVGSFPLPFCHRERSEKNGAKNSIKKCVLIL
jgi:hypothetical protein